tara:strand:+ start:43 stop:1215 length:1173 start_codon:yes stop_codon:yes gene_type:complete
MTDAFLTNSDIAELTEWRRELHRHPELSGEEIETARRVVDMLKATTPDEIITGLGGHGVAAVYESGREGPAVLLRCELDGLPIEELNPDLPYRSTVAGKGHLCGHDGHMTIIAATARWLGRNRPDRGQVILMFQPAEEDGSGAQKTIDDPRYGTITPDYSFALHNFPGVPLGHAALTAGPMNCASRGMRVRLTGRTAHASQPEKGLSPAPALASLLTSLPALGLGDDAADPEFALVTVTHAHLGEQAFGIAPGAAEIWVTLRTQKDGAMNTLVAQAEALVTQAANASGLHHDISYDDIFNHCENEEEATQLLSDALEAEGIPMARAEFPMRGSEDFGRFRTSSKSAMFLLGSGTNCANLHNPDFNFPDDLIGVGARVFVRALKNLCYDKE